MDGCPARLRSLHFMCHECLMNSHLLDMHCVYVCTLVCMCMCMCICMSLCVHAWVYVHVHVDGVNACARMHMKPGDVGVGSNHAPAQMG